MKQLQIYAQPVMASRLIDLYFVAERGHERHIGQEMMFVPMQEGGRPEPSMSIDIQTAQQLIDQLWNCGLRPTEGAGSAGSLAATERHLEDMRKLVFETPQR